MSIENDQFDPDERRIEAMMDGSGFSREQAEIKLGQKVISGATELPSVPRPPRKPHHSRRGGRAYPEKSGRDIGREIANQEAAEQAPIPIEERRAISARGRAAVEAALDEAFGKDRKIQAIIDDVHRMIPIDPDNVAKSEEERERMITARLHTLFDSEK